MTVQPRLDELENLLVAQHEVYRAMLEAVARKREAIRTANVESVAEITSKEGVILRRLEVMETRRRTLMAELARETGAGDAGPLTVRRLAEQLEEPRRTRLLAIAAQLRETILTLRRESSIVRAGAEALGRHMGGIIQSMQTAISRATVYGRGGQVDAAPHLQCSVDVRS